MKTSKALKLVQKHFLYIVSGRIRTFLKRLLDDENDQIRAFYLQKVMFNFPRLDEAEVHGILNLEHVIGVQSQVHRVVERLSYGQSHNLEIFCAKFVGFRGF